MTSSDPKNILVAPLDWGLGHTTRCVPVIRHLQSLGHRVIVAGNDWQRAFIKESIGDIDTVDLEGYNVTYSKWNKWGQMALLSQLPRLQRTIAAEHKWLMGVAKELQLHGIISDNRYGLFHPDIPSVIMTHQLMVQTGMGNVIDRMVQKMHYKHLDHFDTTWVVDTPVAGGLGGILSHTSVLPKHTEYIGLLSQFEGWKAGNDTDGSLLILLSGPEPQRGNLSKILWQQVQQYKGKVIFVDGSDKALPPKDIPANISYHKWLANDELAPVMQAAGMIICRSGYSTIMDLVALRKKAILIPTPGQTEQEYLGRHLQKQGVFYTACQKEFNLMNALKETIRFPNNALALQSAYIEYKHVVEDWIKTL